MRDFVITSKGLTALKDALNEKVKSGELSYESYLRVDDNGECDEHDAACLVRWILEKEFDQIDFNIGEFISF